MKPRDPSRHQEESRKVGALITVHFTSIHKMNTKNNSQQSISIYKGIRSDSETLIDNTPKSENVICGEVGTLKNIKNKRELTTSWF